MIIHQKLLYVAAPRTSRIRKTMFSDTTHFSDVQKADTTHTFKHTQDMHTKNFTQHSQLAGITYDGEEGAQTHKHQNSVDCDISRDDHEAKSERR